MRKNGILKISAALVVILMLVLSGMAFAKGPENTSSQTTFAKAYGIAQPRSIVNIGNWTYWLKYDGESAHTPDGQSGGIYPRGKAGMIYKDGLMWGAYLYDAVADTMIGDQPLRVGGGTYGIGTKPGAWGMDPNDERLGVYRIRADYQTLTYAQVRQDAAEQLEITVDQVTDADCQAIIDQYASDWENWPVDLGAPFYDVDGDGVYTPGTEVDLNGNGTIELGEREEPGIALADQVAWYVVNDADTAATIGLYGSNPIGIELQVTLWAYNLPDNNLGQIVFKKFTFINRGEYYLKDMYVGQWSDPDLGNYGDDLVGCDVDLSMGFVWNGNDVDDHFAELNLAPPAAGYDFFQGPRVYTGDPADEAVWNLQTITGWINLPMTSFIWFAAGSGISDPTQQQYVGTQQWYNLLRGYKPTEDVDSPTPYFVGSGPDKGAPTKFPLSGDPVTDPNGEAGDIDGQGDNIQPADRRLSLNTGPFEMAPGDTQEVVVAVVGGLGGNRYQSISVMKQIDAVAQKVYDLLFNNIPKAPAAPSVKAVAREDHIVLDWGEDPDAVAATESNNYELNYLFEGYNVYQLPSVNATKDEAVRIATFDIVNGVRYIESQYFDGNLGTVVKMPIQFGSDSGIEHFIDIDHDYLTGEQFYKGKKYYFAVTAYNYNDELDADAALESSLIPITVIPQAFVPGESYGSEVGDTWTADHTYGAANAKVDLEVVNPETITGHDYMVFFDLQHYYKDLDGVWKETNYPDSVGKNFARTTDVSPSTVTGAAVVNYESAGTVDLVFTLDLISPDWAWVDGIKIDLPDGLVINSWEAISGAYGSYPEYGQNIVNSEGTLDAAENSITWGDSARSTFGAIEGTVYLVVNVNNFTPPITCGYEVYDDGYSGDIVDAAGTLTIDEIGYEYKTEYYWNVKDLDTDEIIVDDQFTNSDERARIPIADGIAVSVTGNYDAPIDFDEVDVTYADGSTAVYSFSDMAYGGDANVWISSYYSPYGWAPSARSIDAYGQGTSSLDLLISDIEVRYDPDVVWDSTDASGQMVHFVASGGSMATLDGARNYDIADHPLNPNPGVSEPFAVRVPFTVWDVERDKQINILIYDRKQDLTMSDFYVFNPNDRMYCNFLASDYHETVADYAGDELDSLTWNTVWWYNNFGPGDVVKFVYANPLQLTQYDTEGNVTGGDAFTYSTDGMGANAYDLSAAQDDVKKINVFPNPYYAFNSESLNRFNPFVTFNHLPQRATIRIFNLAGQQVRKLEKDDDSQFFRWDLKNESELPVGSGIYFAHIDLPDLGKEKVLKLFVIQRAEILQYF